MTYILYGKLLQIEYFMFMMRKQVRLKVLRLLSHLKMLWLQKFVTKLILKSLKQLNITRADRSKKQYKRANKLTKHLRDRLSKLLVMRIDLCWKALIQDDVTFNQMKVYFSQMLKRFHHDRIYPALLAIYGSWEFGQKKGYHYHCIFFMDGSSSRAIVIMQKSLVNTGQKLTLDKGYYFNCHRDKIKYRHLAIGMAHHNWWDLASTILIRFYCTSASKINFWLINVFLHRKLHVFGTSQPPKANTLGRPRKFKTASKPTSRKSINQL